MEGPTQDYLLDQHLMSREIKIKGSPLSRDLDQVKVTTEKVEGTTVKTTKSNNQERSKAKHPFRQPRRTTLAKTIVGWKEVLNLSTEKPGRTIDSPVLQADLLQYDYCTSSNHPTTLNMTARQIESRVNQKLGGLAKSFLLKFRGYHYAPNHPRRIKGTQAERG